MKKTFNEITNLFCDLNKSIKKGFNEAIKENNGIIALTDEQTKKMKYFTNQSITEIGSDDKVSGEIYFKEGGTITAMSCLSVQIQYNILWQLSEFGLWK